MNKKNKILLLGNVKEDKSTSMHVYLNDIKKYLEDVDVFSPSTKIPPKIYKFFIYPFKIPRGYDIYHIIDHSYGHLGFFLPKNKTIITCHDLIPLKFKNSVGFRGRLLFNFFMEGMKRAKKIISISENTKKDLVKILKIPQEKIKVLHYGLEFPRLKKQSKKKIKEKLGLRNKIVLMSVGNVFYKNTLLVLKSMKELRDIYPNILLVKIGGFSSNEKRFIEGNALEDQVEVRNNLTQREMSEQYSVSDILVFPSIYEGFGRPPLEAMYCGTPVITSNVASLPEVVGDAAIKINPSSVKELSHAISEILENKKLKDDLIKKGKKNVKRFNLKKHCKELMKVYNELKDSPKER